MSSNPAYREGNVVGLYTVCSSCYIRGHPIVGAHTWIGPHTVLDASGGLEIGEWCSIAAGAQIYSHDSVKWALSGGKAEYERGATKIGDRCYIGPNVVISRGVTIGNGVRVGAGAIVLAESVIPDGAFVPDKSLVRKGDWK